MKYMIFILILVAINVFAEVPNSGEEGKKTLLGIDSDNDGIRDDVQIWIDKKYPASSWPSTNNALKQMAKYDQLVLQYRHDLNKAWSYNLKSQEAYLCMEWIIGDRARTNEIRDEYMPNFFNTSYREKATEKVLGNYIIANRDLI